MKLSTAKATKISEICQNIESLVPGTQSSIGQMLLSLNMYSKTASKSVRHGITYTETIFVQDKWAEWTESQNTITPSNICKGVVATHIFDNIDWQNKNIYETHHTYSILVQIYDVIQDFSKVSLKPDYDFKRRDHRSFKGTRPELPSVNFACGSARHLIYMNVMMNKMNVINRD